MRTTKSFSFTETTVRQIENGAKTYGMTASSFVTLCVKEFIDRKEVDINHEKPAEIST